MDLPPHSSRPFGTREFRVISRSDALHQLWTGDAGLPRRGSTRAFDAALDVLCPVRRQLVELASPAGGGRVLLDDTEVMPMISLGDVVAEEFDLTLPYGTLLVFVPRDELLDDAPAERRAAAIGRACGQIVSETLYRGAFPLDRETGIADVLTAACRERARSIPLGGAAASAAFERELLIAVRDVAGGESPAPDSRSNGGVDVLEKIETRLARPGHRADAPNFDLWLEAVHVVTCGRQATSKERAAAHLSPFAAVQRSMPGFGPRGDE
jgi:hypothetical protein